MARSQTNQKNNSKYMSFPGGGIDKGEDAIKGDVWNRLSRIRLNLFPEWADTPKRQERYKQFRGEFINWSFIKPTSDEGDAWIGKKLMTIPSVIKIMEENMKNSHENMYPYHIGQKKYVKVKKFYI